MTDKQETEPERKRAIDDPVVQEKVVTILRRGLDRTEAAEAGQSGQSGQRCRRPGGAHVSTNSDTGDGPHPVVDEHALARLEACGLTAADAPNVYGDGKVAPAAARSVQRIICGALERRYPGTRWTASQLESADAVRDLLLHGDGTPGVIARAGLLRPDQADAPE